MKKRMASGILAFFLCAAVLLAVGVAAAENGGSGTDRDAWIEERLRAIENQYNSGIMLMSFVEGHIPWEGYFTVSGLPANISREKWLADCEKISNGYNVDNTGVRFTKFPQYDGEGVHFVNVTVNGVEVVRAGILVPDNDSSGKPVYYYMTQKHVDSDSSDGSGSHTGSISALILPEDAKFQVNYAVNEYKLSYEIELDGATVTNERVDPADENSDTWEQKVFAGQNPSSTTNGVASFDVTIPYGYTATVWMQREGETALIELTGGQINDGWPLGAEPVYEGSNSDNSIAPNLKKGPSAMRVNATFFDDKVTQNRHIVVKLKKRPDDDPPLFDAHYFLDSENAGWKTGGGTRGVTGTDLANSNNSVAQGGNVQPEVDWQSWGILAEDPAGLTAAQKAEHYDKYWHQETDGTWSLDWVFQTNGGGFILNSLEINGVYVRIPFKPQGYMGNSKNYNDEAYTDPDTYTLTTLPDGAVVKLRMIREFTSGKQWVYYMTITGARTNVTITYGNFFMWENGAEEYVVESLVGVGLDEKDTTPRFQFYRQNAPSGTDPWQEQGMSEIQVQRNVITDFANGDPNHYGANIRFKLYQGFEDPVYSWADRKTGEVLETNGDKDGKMKGNSILSRGDVGNYLDGNKLRTGYIFKDDDGWYYIRLHQKPDKNAGHRMLILSVKATAMKYIVRYMVGDEITGDKLTNPPKDDDVEGMPEFSTDDSTWDDNWTSGDTGTWVGKGQHIERYDDNGGKFYDLLDFSTISISDKEPTDKSGEKFFQYWVVVDEKQKVMTDNDGNPIIVRPNKAIKLSDFEQYGVALGADIGGTDNNYYVIRLKGVWSDLPTDFKFYIRMVWTDAETGKSHVMDLVQNVTTSSTDKNLIQNDRLLVTVNTVTDTFKNWFRLHPFYAYAARNYIPTAERPDNWLKKVDNPADAWEAYPSEFTEGSTEIGVPNPDAYYRLVRQDDIIKYEVQREGTIVLYLEQANGSLPVTKTITGSNPGDDTFTYTITAHLLASDIARSTLRPGVDENYLSPESLMYMLPDGTFFGMAPSASMTDLKDFIGADVELKFKRYVYAADPKKPTTAEMAGWYSTATFTLKGGEATVLGVPQGSYTIEEAKGDSSFKYDVTINGAESKNRTASQTVKVGEVTPTVHFGNLVRITNPPYKLNLSKKIVGLSNRAVPTDAQVGTFGFELKLTGGNSQYVTMPKNTAASITTSGGVGASHFDEISFAHTGTYTFLVTETSYDAEKYLPTPGAHSVTMTVENLNGQLTVTKVAVDKVVYQGNTLADAKVEFTNTYIGDIEEAFALPKVNKDLKGRSTLPAGMFEFELAEQSNPGGGMTLPDNKTATNGNGADGTVVFDPILFTQEGKYAVTVKEKNDAKPGIEYDDRTVTITYTVEMGKRGLEVTDVAYEGGEGDSFDTFENQAYADADFSVVKNYDLSRRAGGSWESDTFTVTATLINAAGAVKHDGESLSPGEKVELVLDKDKTSGKLDFRFCNEGAYTFEVREVNGGLPGVSYDSSVYYVTVTVTSNGEAMNAAVSMTKNGKAVAGNKVAFDNKYDPEHIDVTVNANKVLQNAKGQSISLAAERFRFQLLREGAQSNGLTSSNDASGNVTFTIQNLSKGEYRYTLREIDDGEIGVNYDKTEYTVIVTVDTKEGETAVSYTVTYDGKADIPTFTNTLDGFGQLVVSNTVTGNGADTNKEFTYTFTFDGTDEAFRYELQSSASANGLVANLVMPLFAPESAGTTGTIRSGESIRLRHGQSVAIFGLPLEMAYTVRESDYDGYVVSHDGTYTNAASGKILDATYVPFLNERISSAKASPEVRKVLKGRDTLPAGMFRFTLAEGNNPNDGMTLPDDTTAVNAADGSVVFDPIVFNAEGEYTVTVKENDDGRPGVEYDGKTVTIAYKVELVGTSLQVTETAYQDGVNTFENQAFTDAGFDVAKNYDLTKRPGGGWEGDTFTIIAALTGAAGEVKHNGVALEPGSEVSLVLTESAPNGRFDFRFYHEGVYTFEVRETNGGLPGVSYDGSVFSVAVTVTADGEELTHAVSITRNGEAVSGGTVTFENRYDPEHIDVTVDARKVLQGGSLTAGRFRFSLVSEEEQDDGLIAVNDADGNVVFTLRDLGAGTYTYTLSEINDGESGVVYDPAEYKVTVTVEERLGERVLSSTVTYTKANVPVDRPTFTNAIKGFGQLVVSKTVTGNAGETDRSFRFEATIGGKTYEFTLKNGERWTSDPFVSGTEYTVAETDADEYGYTTTVPANAVGTIQGGQTVNVAFINNKDSAELSPEPTATATSEPTPTPTPTPIPTPTVTPEAKTGSLTVTKRVTGNDGDPQSEFAFMVMLSDTSVSGTYGDMVFNKGVATFTLKHGQSKTASDLPAGVRYSVSEQAANQDGYATAATGESGTIAADTTMTAIFVNTRDLVNVPQTGDYSRLALWMALAVVSLMGIAVFGRKKAGGQKKYFK